MKDWRPWTNEMKETLRHMWRAGKSRAEIAERIGVSVNAIVGQRDRLGLPARVRRTGGHRVNKPLQVKVAKPTKPVAPPLVSAVRRPSADHPSPVRRPSDAAPPAPIAAPRPAPVVQQATGRACCQWPLWEDGATPDHRYCSASVRGIGDPYCAAHHAIAYARAAWLMRASKVSDDVARL